MQTKPESGSAGSHSSAGSPEPIVEVDDLAVHYSLAGSSLARLIGLPTRTVKAVDGVSLDIGRGEVVGLVGESGSGKTTLGRALLGLAPISSGAIRYHGNDGTQDVGRLRGKALRQLRTDLQMVFQDPHAALNPGMTVGQAVGDPLVIHGLAKGEALRRRVAAALEQVGLTPVESFIDKLPGDLSGGQKQRVVIARAIILGPELIVADEPISMLDMSVRAKILQLMLDLKQDLGLTYVYITHDLASAKYFCDRIAIMYLGRIVEVGPTAEIFANPRHPYTQALLKAIPDPDPERSVPRDLPRGEIPDAASPPAGCSFHPRCPVAVAECGWEGRDLRILLETHWTRATPERYAEEARLLGDLAHLDVPGEKAVHLGAGGAAPVRALLEDIRAEGDPFWNGVESLADEGAGVRVTFRPGVDPALRPAGGVDVACVLYPEPGSVDG